MCLMYVQIWVQTIECKSLDREMAIGKRVLMNSSSVLPSDLKSAPTACAPKIQ